MSQCPEYNLKKELNQNGKIKDCSKLLGNGGMRLSFGSHTIAAEIPAGR